MNYSPSKNQYFIWFILIAAFIYGLYQAISLAWVSDDAFISFRYAQNLLNGDGLVFNAGEKVEGYTNFLWTMIIAGGLYLGFEPILLTHILGITFYIATILLMIYLSYSLSKDLSFGGKIIFPVAAMALLFHYDYHVFATSGLETSFATGLITLGFVILISGKTRLSHLFAGVVLVAAVLARPDAMIFYLMSLPYIFLKDKKPTANILMYLSPLLVIYVPYWIVRFSYYGYPFPNTYYAKSAYLSWYSQGFEYLWLYVKTYYILFLIPIILIITLPKFISTYLKEKSFSRPSDRAILLGILFILPYMFYVARVGGDFMFARFLIPVTPVCFFFLESSISLLSRNNLVRYVVALLIIVTVIFRWNQFVPEIAIINGIANERSHYKSRAVKQAQIDGAKLYVCLNGYDVTVGFFGTKAMLIYYSQLPSAIECNTGLTDEYIAHQPIAKRGRPGHEKNVPEEYLFERKINFIFRGTEVLPLRSISFDGVKATIVTYENEVMEKLLANRKIKFMHIPSFLDGMFESNESPSRKQLQSSYDFFKRYYFDNNTDTLRQQKFISLLE